MINTLNNNLIGSVHSIETLGTLDGPGLRTVVFLQGCPLKCKFCHNIDCAINVEGTLLSTEELVNKITKNKGYWGSYKIGDNSIKGGLTFSGGDPTYQPEYLNSVIDLLRLKNSDIHIAIDTCLATSTKTIDSLLPKVDLWMCSIKHMDNNVHKDLTGVLNNKILKNITYLDSEISKNISTRNPKMRIRFLVIPTISDSHENITKLGEFVSKIENLEYLEILKYGSHGKYKWIELFGKYDLENVPDATQEDIQRTIDLLQPFNLPVKY